MPLPVSPVLAGIILIRNLLLIKSKRKYRGNFFWKQLSSAIQNGAEMLYVAMFDEVDEGTAIEKVSQNPPVGPSPFVTFEPGIPSDYYLYLAGYASKVLKKQLPLPESIPLPKSAISAIK